MALAALADFGSTYTKLSLVELSSGRLLARAQAPTTVTTDLMEGHAAALELARAQLAEPVEIDHQLAVSSAGGGLRVAAVGLVADLTAAAAHQAALNAGARVAAVLAGALGAPASVGAPYPRIAGIRRTNAELERLVAARPDIVLFAGGTDGGQAELVLENARRLAAARPAPHAVVACNAAIAAEVAAILAAGGMRAEVAANVMPELGRLEIEGARAAISRAFLEHVIGGKGLSASPEFARMVRMPTPEAVLRATHLLARGSAGRPGAGDLLVIDIGGATTDVHSDRALEAAAPGIEAPLLPAPLTLRTVEGDLGLRAGAAGVVEADGAWLEAQLGAGGEEKLRRAAARRAERPEWIPEGAEEARLDRLLATACATRALERHCGTMLLSRGGDGTPTLLRNGPDLREVKLVVGTGGVLAHRDDGEAVLREALGRRGPRSLAPQGAAVRLDRGYVLAAAGLLAELDSLAAQRLLETELGTARVPPRDSLS